MKEAHINKIRSRGHWRVNFQPLALESLGLKECMELVEKNGVALRGWTYPHFPRRADEHGALEPYGTYYQGWTDWECYKELWRMYRSGQYLHYMGLREDWYGEGVWSGRQDPPKPGQKLNVIASVVFELTEVFEFLARLARSGLYDDGVRVSVSLRNTRGRELWLSDPMRAGFYRTYKTQSKIIEYEGTLSRSEAADAARENARIVIREVFDWFGWHDASDEQIQKDQEALIEGKL